MNESGFVFLGGALALDFINTEVIARGKPQDLLQTANDLAIWWHLTLEQHPALVKIIGGYPECDNAVFQEAKLLRTSLRNIFSEVVAGQRVAEDELQALNNVLSSGSPALISQSDNSFGTIYRLHSTAKSILLFQIALSALELLTAQNLARLHQCQNKRCILFFYDSTRSATRHWCSQDCMNRARSSANYLRLKKDRQL